MVGQPVAAGDGVLAPTFEISGIMGDSGELLIQGSRRESEISRCSVGNAHAVHGFQQAPLQVLGEGWFPGSATWLLESDRRGGDRLVRTTFGCKGDSRGCADQDGLAAGVDAVRPRLEGPGNERVIQRPNGYEPLAPA